MKSKDINKVFFPFLMARIEKFEDFLSMMESSGWKLNKISFQCILCFTRCKKEENVQYYLATNTPFAKNGIVTKAKMGYDLLSDMWQANNGKKKYSYSKKEFFKMACGVPFGLKENVFIFRYHTEKYDVEYIKEIEKTKLLRKKQLRSYELGWIIVYIIHICSFIALVTIVTLKIHMKFF